jgi:hypothetical protein
MHPPFVQTETRLRLAATGASDEITMRLSRGEDSDALRRLAELDGRRLPSGPSILAIVGGQLLAALPLEGGDAIADPFRPTAELVELLRIRNAALHDNDADRRRPFRMRLATAQR